MVTVRKKEEAQRVISAPPFQSSSRVERTETPAAAMLLDNAANSLRVFCLNFDGVPYPDAVYRTRHGIELLHQPGRRLFEHVPVLDEA